MASRRIPSPDDDPRRCSWMSHLKLCVTILVCLSTPGCVFGGRTAPVTPIEASHSVVAALEAALRVEPAFDRDHLRLDPAMWRGDLGVVVRPDRAKRVAAIDPEVFETLGFVAGSADEAWRCQGSGGIMNAERPGCTGSPPVAMVSEPRVTDGTIEVDVVLISTSRHLAGTAVLQRDDRVGDSETFKVLVNSIR